MIIIPDKVVTPQHIRMFFPDATPVTTPPTSPPPPATNVLTVYTGAVGGINFATGEERKRETFQMPVLGLFAGNTKGVFPLLTEEFVGATATVAMTDTVDKTDPQVCQIHSATADLLSVTLSRAIPTGPAIAPFFAVVLTFSLEGYNSEIWGIHYQVTVLTKLVGDLTSKTPTFRGFQPPRLIGASLPGQSWVGGFDSIDGSVPGARMGVPQP